MSYGHAPLKTGEGELSSHPAQTIVVLIHGTKLLHFSKRSRSEEGANWTAKESDFRTKLASYLQGIVVDDAFRWSGANSHTARMQAGDELAGHLRGVHVEYPAARIAILAHSHGGTVALYAMQRLGKPAYISDLIFMNTPFLECRKRNLEGFAAVIRFSLMFVWFLSGILVLKSGWSPFYLFAVMIGAVVSLTVVQKQYSRVQEFLYQSVSLRTPSAPLVNITCNDEVKFWLGFVHYLANLPFRIWSFVSKLGLRLVAICFALSALSILVSIPIFMLHHGSVSEGSPAFAVVTLLLLCWSYLGVCVPILGSVTGAFAIVFCFVLLVAPRAIHGNRFAFGDSLIQNLLLDISAHSEPSIRNEQHYRLWKYSGASVGQKHFAYCYLPAIDYIGQELTAIPECKEPISLSDSEESASEPLLARPERLTWRSVLADLKMEPSKQSAVRSSPRTQAVARVFAFIFLFFLALVVASNIESYILFRKNAAAAKAVGFPANITYYSETTVPPDRLRRIANTLSGYQSYLEAAGHPTSWPNVRVTVVRTLEPENPNDPLPHVETEINSAPPDLKLNGSSLPGPEELVENYSEILFSPPQFSPFSVARTEASVEYFCFSYVGSFCTSGMIPTKTWPEGSIGLGEAYSGGYALAQALIEIRSEAGGDVTDSAVMRAFLNTRSEQSSDLRLFLNTILQQLEPTDAALRAHFEAHRIPAS